jgi:hypothetical protein
MTMLKNAENTTGCLLVLKAIPNFTNASLPSSQVVVPKSTAIKLFNTIS